MKTLEREVSIMIKIRHPNVILFMGVCLEPPAVVTGEGAAAGVEGAWGRWRHCRGGGWGWLVGVGLGLCWCSWAQAG